jgi:hypothetical protein
VVKLHIVCEEGSKPFEITGVVGIEDGAIQGRYGAKQFVVGC